MHAGANWRQCGAKEHTMLCLRPACMVMVVHLMPAAQQHRQAKPSIMPVRCPIHCTQQALQPLRLLPRPCPLERLCRLDPQKHKPEAPRDHSVIWPHTAISFELVLHVRGHCA